MRRLLATFALSIGLIMSTGQAALAVGELDQQQPVAGNGYAVYTCYGQVFTAGITGPLDKISLLIGVVSGDANFMLEVRATTNGLPNSQVLATETMTAADVAAALAATGPWLDVAIDPPVESVAGTSYAFTLKSDDDYRVGYDGDTYPGGKMVGNGDPDSCTGDDWFYMDFGGSDLAFKTYVRRAVFQPDARLRLDFGSLRGNDVYNDVGTGQTIITNGVVGDWRLFRVNAQNDGDWRDKYGVAVASNVSPGYQLKWIYEGDDVTPAVRAGTFQTDWIQPGSTATLEAWVRTTNRSPRGSSLTRTVKLTSFFDPSKVDATTFTLRRR